MASQKTNTNEENIQNEYVKADPLEHVIVETEKGMRDIGQKAYSVYIFKGVTYVLDKDGNPLISGKLTGEVDMAKLIKHVRDTLEGLAIKYVVLPDGGGVVSTFGITSVMKVSNDKVLVLANDSGKNVLFWTGHPKKVNENFENFKHFIKGEVTEIHWV
jgi:hypothetical protein